MVRKDEIVPLEEAQKRKKKKENKPDYTALNKQVMRDDKITIEDVRQFITDAKKYQEDYRNVADRSWAEIEKRGKDGKLFGGQDLYKTRRWTRFPLWWSCLKIRQPLTLARLPIPILKDTQGDDPFGRTACVIGERFTRSILKTFEAFPEFASANDDFLVTNFGWGRPFYRMVECEKPEKIRLQMIEPEPIPAPPMQDMPVPEGEEPPPMEGMDSEPLPPPPPIFITPDGMQVDPSQVMEDDLGPYLLTGQDVTIEEEEIYFEAGLYADLLVDPDIRKWNKVTKLAFRYQYSYREFKEKFGQKALDTLKVAEIQEHKDGKPIIVYEYWDKFLREVYWCAENSEDFFQPKSMDEMSTDSLQEVEGDEDAKDPALDNSDLYGLSTFFPCTEPLSMNQSTKHFWPTPEYFQVQDMLDYVHECVGRMVQLSKAVRVRFFFDSSVTELKTLIGENWAMGEGTGIGIPDLETTLMNNKGNLSTLVAYFPVKELLEGLETQYRNFQRGLDIFYQSTGLSDLIRGQTDPNSDKTFGERQMEGKYALNRIEPFQRKVQEWIKDQYQLMMEMGLKMFRQDTVDEYVTPQTLDKEDQERYTASLELLKDNKRRRFRMDFETDSTIAINEEWKKSKAIETANVISEMIESTAKVAEDNPDVAAVELKLMQHVVGDLVDGKLFIDEIQDAIQDAIDKAKAPKDPEPNIELEKLKLERERFIFDQQRAANEDKFEQFKTQMETNIELSKNAQTAQLDQINQQIEQFKISTDAQTKQTKIAADAEAQRAKLELEYQSISAEISKVQQELELKRAEMMVELRKIADKKEVDQFALMIDARVAGFEEKLQTAQLELEKTHGTLDMQERFITEQRLQAEHQLQLGHSKIESLEKIVDIALKKKELDAPVEIKTEPLTKATDKAKPKKKKSKILRDKNGEILEIHSEESD